MLSCGESATRDGWVWGAGGLERRGSSGRRTCHGPHGVELELEIGAGEESSEHVEIEDLLEERFVVRHGVHDLDGELAKGVDALLGEIDVRNVGHLELGQCSRLPVDLVRDGLGRGLARRIVELDAEVLVLAAGIVRC